MKLLEISNGTAAAYAGLLAAELGFEVDRIDLAEKHPHVDPLDATADEIFLHRGKTTVTATEGAAGAYDAIVEDIGSAGLQKLGLTYGHCKEKFPNIVFVSLSDFGASGPYKDWASTDINAQAAGGVIHGSGFHDEAPRKLPVDAAQIIAGLHGATAAISTVFGIENGTEEGVHIDISAQDALMQHWTRHVSDYAYSGAQMRRQDRDPVGFHYRHTARASDGWVFMLALRQPWQDVAAFLGLGDFIVDLDEDARQPPWDEIEAAYEDAVTKKARYQWFEQAADLGWTFAPVEDPWAVANGPQTTARQSMQDVAIDGRSIKVPGLPFRFEAELPAAPYPEE